MSAIERFHCISAKCGFAANFIAQSMCGICNEKSENHGIVQKSMGGDNFFSERSGLRKFCCTGGLGLPMLPILSKYLLKWYGMVSRHLPEMTAPILYFLSPCLSAKLINQIVLKLCHITKYLYTNVLIYTAVFTTTVSIKMSVLTNKPPTK